MKREFFATALAVLFMFGVSSPAYAGGPRPGARVIIDCTATTTGMTVTVDAKSKGGGKPQQIAEAGPVFILIDQKIGKNYVGVSVGSRWNTMTLPVTANFNFCSETGSIISPDASAIRGRGTLYIPDVGFVSGQCSPKKPPSC